MSDPQSGIIACYNCKCPMYHHRSTDQCLFRFFSIHSSLQCSEAMRLCMMCQQVVGDTSWAEVRSWKEWRDEYGNVVDSTYNDQLAMQGAVHCAAVCAFGIMQVPYCAVSGCCWLFSAPGLVCCKGNGQAAQIEWSDRCSTKHELVGRYQGELNTRPPCTTFSSCSCSTSSC